MTPAPGRLYLLPSGRTVLFREAGREGDECEYWPAADEVPVPAKERLVTFRHGWLDRRATLLDWRRRPAEIAPAADHGTFVVTVGADA